MSALPLGRLLTSAALALGATFLIATPALAAPPGWVPNPGDNRAIAHPGNVTTCQEAGLKGTISYVTSRTAWATWRCAGCGVRTRS